MRQEQVARLKQGFALTQWLIDTKGNSVYHRPVGPASLWGTVQCQWVINGETLHWERL